MQREIIKINEAVKITGLSYSAIKSRINKGFLSRPDLDNPYSKKRTLRVYKDEIERISRPIEKSEIQEDKIIIKHKLEKEKIAPKRHADIKELLKTF